MSVVRSFACDDHRLPKNEETRKGRKNSQVVRFKYGGQRELGGGEGEQRLGGVAQDLLSHLQVMIAFHGCWFGTIYQQQTTV